MPSMQNVYFRYFYFSKKSIDIYSFPFVSWLSSQHCESFARKEEEIRRMGRRYFRFNVLPHHALVITYENNRVICVHQ